MSEFKMKYEDVEKHASAESLWVIVKGQAYDLTEFAPEHPGGMKILLKYAGKDATEAYEPIHPPGTLEQYLPKEKHLGSVDMTGVEVVVKEETEEEKQRKIRVANKPPIDECLSLYDFEAVAKSILPTAAWAYYSSGADDEITMRENRSAYQRIWFRPRVLRDVTEVDYSSTILGMPTSLPIYMTATALGRLGHPDGEKNLTWAGAETGTIQMIPTLASCSFDEIVDEAAPGQNLIMQLYVNKDHAITERIVRHAEERGVKGLFITVDAPQLGRREKDMRQKFADEGSNVQQGSTVDKSQGAARAISSFIDPGLCWKDIEWFKTITKMPIVLKGVQCWEDAVLAAENGLAGVVLSNHGGRQLDFARSGIEILVETMAELRQRDLLKNGFEVYIDGGVRRAGDVIKAIALGAKAVGLGRPLLYAYCAYGKEGVVRAIQLLKDEMEMNLRLIGAPTLADVTPDMVDISALHHRAVDSAPDHLMRQNYEPLSGVGQGLGAKPRL
ncbi:FMN-dependent dehydrogenase-domain-containing protein [Leucosporidium creatinivorum]|uniref:L-lactate dehydrogenase (cytochrome) n=1 Tax=Leucosporidium creatinivorum TaxID=106004 RepID=A0A1Y2G0C9_9BASI|nr:FMN-dependent dehydrogenase-domain-containing protein [Leucosporidium creatinivorum]